MANKINPNREVDMIRRLRCYCDDTHYTEYNLDTRKWDVVLYGVTVTSRQTAQGALGVIKAVKLNRFKST